MGRTKELLYMRYALLNYCIINLNAATSTTFYSPFTLSAWCCLKYGISFSSAWDMSNEILIIILCNEWYEYCKIISGKHKPLIRLLICYDFILMLIIVIIMITWFLFPFLGCRLWTCKAFFWCQHSCINSGDGYFWVRPTFYPTSFVLYSWRFLFCSSLW